MPALYRVFPYLESAAPDEPGGALFAPARGGGRLDNPGRYSVLYLGDSAPGAIAEAFGRFPEWTRAILGGSPALPGSARAIARYTLEASANVCDLDDPERLLDLELRPSQVVSRDYTITRDWARRIYERETWIGARWWSYYDSSWASFGLWETRDVVLREIRLLRLEDPELVEASRTIVRRVSSGRVS